MKQPLRIPFHGGPWDGKTTNRSGDEFPGILFLRKGHTDVGLSRVYLKGEFHVYIVPHGFPQEGYWYIGAHKLPGETPSHTLFKK